MKTYKQAKEESNRRIEAYREAYAEYRRHAGEETEESAKSLMIEAYSRLTRLDYDRMMPNATR